MKPGSIPPHWARKANVDSLIAQILGAYFYFPVIPAWLSSLPRTQALYIMLSFNSNLFPVFQDKRLNHKPTILAKKREPDRSCGHWYKCPSSPQGSRCRESRQTSLFHDSIKRENAANMTKHQTNQRMSKQAWWCTAVIRALGS